MEYIATATSNYFRVKDREAFLEFVHRYHLQLEIDNRLVDGVTEPIFSIYLKNDAGWPTMLWNEHDNMYIDVDIYKDLAPHLADEEVAVLFEAGSEGIMYVAGSAVAINNKGERIEINLQDIYKRATVLGDNLHIL